MRLKPQTALIISAAILVIGIVLTSVLGLWTTESTKIPKKIAEGDSLGQYDPADIRGSYTFADISKSFSVPVEDLAAAFQVEQSQANGFQCKGLESKFADAPNEIGTGSVRLFVALYANLPYEPTEDTYLPDTAAEVLKAKSNLSPENFAYIESHTVKTS
ncbi:MAG: hypothetical protein ACYCX2_04105 [Christensenellales bacterium]